MCYGQMSIHVILDVNGAPLVLIGKNVTWPLTHTSYRSETCYFCLVVQTMGTHHPINRLNTIHVLLTDVNGASSLILLGIDVTQALKHTNQDVRWPLTHTSCRSNYFAWPLKQFLDTYHPINKLNTLHVLWTDQSIIGTYWQRCYMTIDIHLLQK